MSDNREFAIYTFYATASYRNKGAFINTLVGGG